MRESIAVLRNQDRNCGPTAVAKITGWHVDRVVMHIRALREQKGQRLSLRGGTQPSEYMDALRVAGWQVEPDKVRCRLSKLGTGSPRAWWLCHQPRHVFAFRRATDWPVWRYGYDARVVAQRVTRIKSRQD